MTRVWLIRHGEPAEELRNRCYGSLDAGLSQRGRAQMAEIAQYLKLETIAAVYTSPSSRALDSARIIAAERSCRFEIVKDLREIHFGDFEGLPYAEIASRYPDLYRQWMEKPTEVKFPNGESFAEMRVRIFRAFEEIHRESNGQTIAIVSHGGVNRILVGWALGMPDHCIFRLAQDYAAINLLQFEEGLPIVRLLNYCRECGTHQNDAPPSLYSGGS
jgi:alpha-ribazole phosphatase